MLTPDDKRELLSIARAAIAGAVHGTRIARPVLLGAGTAQGGGAFVTIRIANELRGCIGYIESEKPLADVVAEVAMKAAIDDPRFPPLTPDELESARIEISVLSPLHRINSPEEITLGIHGLVVAQGARRGLLLPQIAEEHGLDRNAFIEATMRKAGLPVSGTTLNSGRSGLEMYTFEAEVLREADILQ